MPPQDRPHRPRLPRGKWMALVLAIVVNLIFLGVLIFSVSWRRSEPVPVSAELYAPPPKPVVEQPKPPEPNQEPPPPPPEPKPEPKPDPKPPPPPIEKPTPNEAEIALKAKAEAERRERERREAEAKKQEEKRQEEKRQEEKRQAEARERQQKELAAMRAQAEREAQQRQRQSEMIAQANREARERQQQQAASAANAKALADWTDKIRAKVRSNVIEPPDLVGNPEAIFDVVLLPTGEVIDVQLRKSSGVRAYDDAVSRAILKSSPLPKPDRPEIFTRSLRLTFRPRE